MAARAVAQLRRQLLSQCFAHDSLLTSTEDAGALADEDRAEICALTRECFEDLDAADDGELYELLFRPNEPIAGGQCRIVRCFLMRPATAAERAATGATRARGALLGLVLGAVHKGLERRKQLTVFNLAVSPAGRGHGLATQLLCALVGSALAEGSEVLIGHVTTSHGGADGKQAALLLQMYGHFGAQPDSATAAGSTAATQQRLRIDLSTWDSKRLETIAAGGGWAMALALVCLLGLLFTVTAWALGGMVPRPKNNEGLRQGTQAGV